jgi:hypothetical protein
MKHNSMQYTKAKKMLAADFIESTEEKLVRKIFELSNPVIF